MDNGKEREILQSAESYEPLLSFGCIVANCDAKRIREYLDRDGEWNIVFSLIESVLPPIPFEAHVVLCPA